MTRTRSERPTHAGPECANAADDKVDLHAVARGAVERAYDIRVRESIQLRDDPRRIAGAGVLRFSLYSAKNSGSKWCGATRSDSDGRRGASDVPVSSLNRSAMSLVIALSVVKRLKSVYCSPERKL
jgi:hypothetical protein